MAAIIGRGVLDVAFDPKQVEQAGKEQVLPSARRIAGDVAATFAAVKLIQVNKEGLDELKQAEAATANVNAVIKATGGAANVSAQHVDELAESQLKLTGTDDEVIKQGAAKLLTFKQVANQVGAGNDVFDRATKLSLDLAQLGFGTVESASVLLGKALNDPVKGLTALQRVGVALTEGQKAQVRALVESGDVLGAQKIILAEVESQVGGAAAAYGDTLPGKIDIAKQSLANMKGDLVAAEAPLIELGAEGVGFLTDKLQELPEGAQAAVGGLVVLTAGAAAVLGPARDAVQILDSFAARRAAKAAADLEEAGTSSASAAGMSAQATAAAELASAEVAATGTAEAQAVANAELAASETAAASAADVTFASLWAETGAAEANTVAASEAAVAWEAFAASSATGGAGAGAGVAAAAGSVAVFAAGAAIAAGAAYGLAKGIIWVDEQATNLPGYIDAANKALAGLKQNADEFNAKSLNEQLDDLVRGNADFADALQHAGKTTDDLVYALLGGSATFGKFAADLAVNTNLTHDDRDAIDAMVQSTQDLAQQALTASVATGGLSQSALDGAIAGHKFSSGATDWIAVLADLANKGLISKKIVDDVAEAAGQEIDNKALQATATWYDTIAKNADEAFTAALQLAPADIRVQRGVLTIEEDKQKVADAEKKLADARAFGTPETVAAAERDLQTARLDLQQATLDEAEAQKELTADWADAEGLPLTLQQQTDVYRDSLINLNDTITGPVHGALAQNIWDLTVLESKTIAARDANAQLQYQMALTRNAITQEDLANNLSQGGTSFGGFAPSAGFASGGDVAPGQVFRGGEQGWELGVIPKDALYQAPPSGMHVIDHVTSMTLTSSSRGRGGGLVIEGDVIVQGQDAPRAVRRLPDELRAAAFLAGV